MRIRVSLCVLAAGLSSAAGQVVTWNDPAGGLWGDAANWSPMSVPNDPLALARIDLGGIYTVGIETLDVQLEELDLANPLVTLRIDNGRTLQIGGDPGDGMFANSGRIEVGAGSVLRLVATDGSQSPTAAVVLDGGNLELAGPDVDQPLLVVPFVSGGVLQTTGAGGVVRSVEGTSGLADMTFEADVEIDQSASSDFVAIDLEGDIVNNGTISLLASPTNDGPFLFLRDGTTLSGTGRIWLEGGPNDFEDSRVFGTSGGPTIVQEADHAIEGAGRVNFSFTNRGVVRAIDTGTDNTLLLGGTNIVNEGLIAVSPGAELALASADITQQMGGEIAIDGGRLVVNRSSGPSGNEIEGGRIVATNGGEISVSNLGAIRLRNTLVESDIVFDNRGRLITEQSGFTINGDISWLTTSGFSGSEIQIFDNATIDGAGTITLPEDTFTTISGTTGGPTSFGRFGTGIEVRGSFMLRGRISFRGLLSLGQGPGEIGSLTRLTGQPGRVLLAPTSVVEFEIGGTDPSEHDRIDIASAELDGRLELSVINGYVPMLGDTITLIQTDPGGLGGAFDVSVLPDMIPAVGTWRLVVTDSTVELRVVESCPADLSSPTVPGSPDGVLTGADFFEFLARFQAGDLRADFSSAGNPGTPDGVLTGADFFEFLSLFQAGCP